MTGEYLSYGPDNPEAARQAALDDFGRLVRHVSPEIVLGLLDSADQAQERGLKGATESGEDFSFSVLVDEDEVNFRLGKKSHIISPIDARIAVIQAFEEFEN